MKKLFPLVIFVSLMACAKEEGDPLINPPGQTHRTQYNSIQIVGDFQGWNLNDFENTKMDLVQDYKWERLTYFNAPQDSIRFKIVANRDWNYAFGTVGADTGLTGYAEPNCNGLGDHITAGPIYRAGYWKFEFNENTLFYRISLVSTPQGKIYGKVAFQDDSLPPLPEATIRVYRDTVSIVSVKSDTLTGNYEVSNLEDGNYRLYFEAAGYKPDSISLTISGWSTIDAGTVVLVPEAGNEYAFADGPFVSIQVDGNLSDWPYTAVQDTIGDSPWAASGDLGALYVGHDERNLYIAVDYVASNNAIIIYINVNNADTTDGTLNGNTLDWFARNFLFADSTPAEFIVAKWVGEGAPEPALRHILSGTTTQEVPQGDYEVINTVPPSGGRGVVEVRIPYDVLYNLGQDRVMPYAKARVVVVIAGGDNWNGPESLPENSGTDGSGAPTLLENMYVEEIDSDGQ
ncbi:MAG TPA: hypothetical protein PKU94_04425 [Candidatus Hydrothermia bacterium]|nr:hypothetical protein [Candidatus Hydrothermae bacterium]MDD3648640.1 hypothetical protein [Candidatus Hydrothermia bacterium]MDD5572220.1 hypothetical protein [Candidatus Hydrothermia bacterium]HOK22500.1 hypothetical protein [Candidatus Hydrothermia bacterium]HOL23207.1 hypothetical protein [Candidatus Hydrothermia bacterium]